MLITPTHVRKIEEHIPPNDEIPKLSPVQTIQAARDTIIPLPPQLATFADKNIFENWVQDIESYFRLYGITDASRKYGLFMIYGGPPLNQILRDNRRRIKMAGDLDEYSKSVTIISEGFTTIYNVIQERQKFRAAAPKVGENPLKYLERLAQCSETCEFNKYSAEDGIVDQFIEKCLDGNIKRRLLKEVGLDLRKLVLIVKQMKDTAEAMQPAYIKETKESEIAHVIDKRDVSLIKETRVTDPSEMKVHINYSKERKEEIERLVLIESAKKAGKYPSKESVFFGLDSIRKKGRPRTYQIDQFFYTNTENGDIKVPTEKEVCSFCTKKGHFETACLTKIRKSWSEKQTSFDIDQLKSSARLTERR